MFPHVVQPLRIFEPRYLEMFEDALASDQLITMTLLETGSQSEFTGEPIIRPVCCLGQIISHSQQKDGSYHCLLAGLKRVLVIRELDEAKLYRSAKVELIDDLSHGFTPEEDMKLQKSLISAYRTISVDGSTTEESLEKLLKSQLSLGMLSDVIAYSAPLQITQKQKLLEEFNVKSRSETLIEYLQQLSAVSIGSQMTFPPEFSEN